MGLFDSLKKQVGDLAKEVEKHKDDIQKEVSRISKQAEAFVQQKQSAPSQPSSAPAQTYTPAPSYTGPEAKPVTKKSSAEVFAHFSAIIDECFAGYEVKKNLPASALQPGCHPACTPVQFMFYKNGLPAVAVVLVRENNYRGMNVIAAKQICESQGITYVRFYEEYANEKSYVVDRINKFLA